MTPEESFRKIKRSNNPVHKRITVKSLGFSMATTTVHLIVCLSPAWIVFRKRPLEPFLSPVPRLISYIMVDGEQSRTSAIALSVYFSFLYILMLILYLQILSADLFCEKG